MKGIRPKRYVFNNADQCYQKLFNERREGLEGSMGCDESTVH